MKLRYISALILTSTLYFSGCGGPPKVMLVPGQEQVYPVATAAEDLIITNSQLLEAIRVSEFVPNGGTIDEGAINGMLDSVLVDTLAGFEAREVDLVHEYHDYRLFQQQYYDKLISTFWDEVVYKKVSGDSLEAVQFYLDHPDLFSVKEQVDLYHILISARGLLASKDSLVYRTMSMDKLREEAGELAHSLARLIDYGEIFENVAYVFSHDVTSNSRGGHIGWTTRGVYLDPFDSVAFSLPVGVRSDPYHDKDGWHIIKIGAYQPEGPVPIDSPSVFESARLSMLTHKGNLRSDSIIDSLKHELNVRPNQEILDTNIYFVADPTWVGLVNEIDTIDAKRLKELEEGYREKYRVNNTTPEIKLEMIKFAAERWMLVQVARSHGIDTLERMRAEWDRLWQHRSKAVAKRQAYDYEWTPEEEEIQAYYDKNLSRFVDERPLTFDLFTVNDSAFAYFAHEQLKTGLSFEDLMRDYRGQEGLRMGIEQLKDVGQRQIPGEAYRVSQEVNAGQYSRPFQTRRGWHIMRLIHRNVSKSYIEAKGLIAVELQRSHRTRVWEDFRDRLYAKYDVKFPNRITGSLALEPRWIRVPRQK